MNTLFETLTLFPSELFTLASLLGGEMLIGVPDPFPGWLTEEIQQAMQEAQNSLTHKGYLHAEGDELKVDALVAALIGTIIQPQAVILSTLSRSSAPLQQEGLYHRPPFIVHLSPQQDGYGLFLLAEYDEVSTLLRQRWRLEAKNAAPAKPFSLSRADFQAIRQALEHSQSNAAFQILQRAGADEDSAFAFLSTWQTARSNGSLVALRQRDTWQVGGLGFLEGENGLWRLRSFQSNAQDWVECIPCSATELWQQVETLLERYFFE